jgi:hypothetical protein
MGPFFDERTWGQTSRNRSLEKESVTDDENAVAVFSKGEERGAIAGARVSGRG